MPGSKTAPGRTGARNGAPVRIAFRQRYSVGAQNDVDFAAQWLAYAIPCRRFADILADACARLGADVVCYSFIAVDFHHLLLAGLPAHAALDPTVIELREWSRIASDLGTERNRLTNRLREQLWRYFPAMLELEIDLGAPWLLDLWELAPTPGKAARIREGTVAKLLKRHRIRRFDAAHVLDVLRKPAVQVAGGTVEAASAHIKTLVARIRLVNGQVKEAHRRLDALTARLIPAEDAGAGQQKQHDVEILASLPGVGRIVLATLLAEAWDGLQRRDYAALRSLTGVAPVTKKSGKSCIVIRRQACSNRLANVMYHWARVAIQLDAASKAKYATLRGRGHSHGRALRSVGDRLLSVACAMLKNGALFNPSFNAQNTPC